jgi:hypothetical protein
MNRNERIRKIMPLLVHADTHQRIEFDWAPPTDSQPLDDIGLFPDLAALVESTHNADVKYIAYAHIADLAHNLGNEEIYGWLVGRLVTERKPECIADILRPISMWEEENQLVARNPTPYVPFLNHRVSDIRFFAVLLVGRSRSPEAESALLSLVERERDKTVLEHALEGLRRCGTERCLPILMKCVFARTPGVQTAALTTMMNLYGSRQARFYIEVLEDKRFTYKWCAMTAIMKYSGEAAIEPVIRRVKAILGNKNRVPYNTPLEGVSINTTTELTEAIIFLQKHFTPHSPVDMCFQLILKHWSNVWDHEKSRIIRECSYFREAK